MNEIGQRIRCCREDKYLSQDDLAKMVGVSKSTISQWELGKTLPKHKNFRLLANSLGCSISYLEEGVGEIREERSEYQFNVRKIPFFNIVKVAANAGCFNQSEEFRYIHIDDLPVHVSDELICLLASGDSMEPVIKHGSLLVVDTSKTNIIDGKVYVFHQAGIVRMKLFSYEKNHLKLASYNERFKDEMYRFDEIDELTVIGQVMWFSTKLE